MTPTNSFRWLETTIPVTYMGERLGREPVRTLQQKFLVDADLRKSGVIEVWIAVPVVIEENKPVG